MILVIDNYDSFTYNLVHYLMEVGARVEVVRNDALSADEALARKPEGVLISPGPCTPDEAGISLDMVARCAETGMPLLGVCLGHQAIGQHFGGRIVRGGLMHGKTSPIAHDGTGVFQSLPSPIVATRYHSLVVDKGSAAQFEEALAINAWSEDGLIMGLRHRRLPIHGVQFHPESIASEKGHAILENFLRICAEHSSRRAKEPS